MIGMISPAIFATAMQPSALATLLIAGIPFWSLLFLWLALVLDGLDLGPARVRSDLQARTSLTTVPETSVRR
jgi:hypothetical protein